MKFIIIVFQFKYLLILLSNAASYNYTIEFSTDTAGLSKVGWAYTCLYFLSY